MVITTAFEQLYGFCAFREATLFVTLNLIQSRIIEQFVRDWIILIPSELAGDSGSSPEWRIRGWCRGLRVEFGLFGWSENASFSSTLRAWFAIAHSSPYWKTNRSDENKPLRDTPHPAFPKSGKVQNPIPVQGILNLAPLFRMSNKQSPYGILLIPAFKSRGRSISYSWTVKSLRVVKSQNKSLFKTLHIFHGL